MQRRRSATRSMPRGPTRRCPQQVANLNHVDYGLHGLLMTWKVTDSLSKLEEHHKAPDVAFVARVHRRWCPCGSNSSSFS